jgi:twitching motility protein PilT
MDLIGINELLKKAVDEKASDIHLTVGVPPMIRVHGQLRGIEGGDLK